MNTIRRAVLAIVLGASLPGLGACSDAGDAISQAGAAAGVTVSNARVVLAPVAGNPAAVYFELAYTGSAPVTLTGVAVEGTGMTMIHDYAESAGTLQMTMAGPITLAKGVPVTFAPGGLHVMAMEPSDALVAGGMAKVTLSLSDGSAITVEAPVRSAGEDR